ncbi:hypothetical protein AZE42_06964 [Rhizopogon vesiculosus]|uniref:Uncharacterized protein n=1 Tax=Rhizopogon vesiculosus TaxID=180088 RepID=A0A1J8Q5R0_9AGAM|nr:hypothetical protein AZE42_06964 [Rhizopogon vesiculosus]
MSMLDSVPTSASPAPLNPVDPDGQQHASTGRKIAYSSTES